MKPTTLSGNKQTI